MGALDSRTPRTAYSPVHTMPSLLQIVDLGRENQTLRESQATVRPCIQIAPFAPRGPAPTQQPLLHADHRRRSVRPEEGAASPSSWRPILRPALLSLTVGCASRPCRLPKCPARRCSTCRNALNRWPGRTSGAGRVGLGRSLKTVLAYAHSSTPTVFFSCRSLKGKLAQMLLVLRTYQSRVGSAERWPWQPRMQECERLCM